jgi:hypothetical protein
MRLNMRRVRVLSFLFVVPYDPYMLTERRLAENRADN